MSENKPKKINSQVLIKHGCVLIKSKIRGQLKICHVLRFLMVQKLQPNDNQTISLQNKSKGTNNVFF
jgi:hypothetical protein